jgi:hypothetical protein
MRKITYWLLVVAILLASWTGVNAQDATQISELEVDIWPEYDQPTVLVIYHITLAPNTTFPTPFAIRIPAAAGEPHAVAVRQPDDALVNLEYTLDSDGTWITLNLVANLPELQIEYYDPGITKDGALRNYTYQWQGDYAVGNMLIEIQQPADASEMAITPGPVEGGVDQAGLTYYTKEVGQVPAGQEVTIALSYQKSSDLPSVSQLQVEPSAPLTSENVWQDRMLGALPWVLGALGVGLIAGGAIWYWRSGQQTASAPRKRHRSRSTAPLAPATSADTSENQSIYCHQCGKRAASGDRFCRSCGTRLRVE